jgi:tRNA (cytidine/uridine-2'-O-)-methyltransferase
MIKIAFYQPDIAGNIGTMIRTAACLDLEIHIIEPCGFVFDLQKIRRSAMDYIDQVKLIRHNSFEDFYQNEIAAKPQNRLILLTTKAKNDYTKFNFAENDILLFGRESAGVPESVSSIANHKIKIPMKNNMRSLNVAVSAAMVIGEAMRQISP